MRRLTEDQYRNTISQLFGNDITYGGHFDRLQRTDGLLELGARTARITPSGFEQYYTVARSVAAQVVDPAHRDTLIPCKPASAKDADDACAKQFLSHVGRLLYRRPLTAVELDLAVKSAHDVGASRKDFFEGLAFSLAGMMSTPEFLFVVDMTEPDPDNKGAVRLTGYARASRLSFLLWDSPPDDMLLTAAEKGDLFTSSGLHAQIDRMIASANLDTGVRAFFTDFLDLDKFETVEKDPVIYPAFGAKAVEDAKEQLLRTVTDHLVERDGDYRDLFTTRHTFMTGTLGRIYNVAVDRPDGGWEPYDFPPDDPRAGILTEVGFLAANSHPGRSSPTVRGRALREVLLCQKVPDPPSNVSFALFNDPNTPHKTARQRLTAHATAPTCAGCHKITDPIGLALEDFDSAGSMRETEGGEKIDTTGNLDGVEYKDAKGLAQAMHDNARVPLCLVDRLYTYAIGRPATNAERESVFYFQKLFAQDGYRLPELLRQIASSDALFKLSPNAAAPASGPSQASSTTDANKENHS